MQIHSIFVGKPKTVDYNKQSVLTGIFKEPIVGPVKLDKLNLEGDEQADLKVHGGPDKAVYAYPIQHYDYWRRERPDLEFTPGKFGENLVVEGMNEQEVCIGDVYRINDCEVFVTSPRMPCFKLGIKMGDPSFIKDFMLAAKTGFYFRVLKEGFLDAGNAIEKLSDDGYGLTVEEIVKLYTVEKNNTELLQKAVASPSLPEDWREFFEKRL